jgi:hypothetical protein
MQRHESKANKNKIQNFDNTEKFCNLKVSYKSDFFSILTKHRTTTKTLQLRDVCAT